MMVYCDAIFIQSDLPYNSQSGLFGKQFAIVGQNRIAGLKIEDFHGYK